MHVLLVAVRAGGSATFRYLQYALLGHFPDTAIPNDTSRINSTEYEAWRTTKRTSIMFEVCAPLRRCNSKVFAAFANRLCQENDDTQEGKNMTTFLEVPN